MRTILFLLLPLLCSCAATFGTGPFLVPVDSTPQGAIVRYQGHDYGRTPCVVRMTNDSDRLTLRLDGHHPQEVMVRATSNGGYVILGILLWGPFELISAAIADAWSGLEERPLLVPLVPAEQPEPKLWVLPEPKKHRGGSGWRAVNDGR